jgi:DNA polymerase-3 subunit chi
LSRVDFYILPDVDGEARFRFACRLAYKAWAQGAQVRVRVDDESAAAELDALMWEYPPTQFLPHALAGSEHADVAPVVIEHDSESPAGVVEALLINLSAAVPEDAARYARIAEIIAAPDREIGRSRYRHYRHEGHPLHHHELEDWEA